MNRGSSRTPPTGNPITRAGRSPQRETPARPPPQVVSRSGSGSCRSGPAGAARKRRRFTGASASPLSRGALAGIEHHRRTWQRSPNTPVQLISAGRCRSTALGAPEPRFRSVRAAQAKGFTLDDIKQLLLCGSNTHRFQRDIQELLPGTRVLPTLHYSRRRCSTRMGRAADALAFRVRSTCTTAAAPGGTLP